MLRFRSVLRCLRAVRLPSASYATAAGSAPLLRTVRVENLLSGYDVGSIIEAIKANPSEAVLPSKDHLLVQFFDECTARRCVEASNGVKSLSLKIDESTSAPLDDATIAKIGLHEYDLKQTLSKYEGVDVRFNLAETETDIHFLDIHQAVDAHTDLKAIGGTPAYLQVIPDDYIFLSGIHQEDQKQRKPSSFPNSLLLKFVMTAIDWSWIWALALYLSSLRSLRDVGIKSFFPSTSLARQFVEECKVKPDAFGIKVSLESTVRRPKASATTAVCLGATRVVSLPVTVDPFMFGKLQHFFGIYGDVAQWGISCTHGR
ncbi:hypothetical protein DFS33DRAFT_1380788 [Desarmillaria ectypa]|nr:hypothetical protein DFS33DRAFT_1380788 [Desarmillaria ectypa]